MHATDQPIGAAERNRLLGGLQLPLAVAVSGGSDSMALMHLVAGWARAVALTFTLPKSVAPVLVITVDHGLRPDSGAEAEFVSREAARLGLAHAILRWTGPKPRTAIQEAARNARYALICERIGSEALAAPRPVLVAHHLDDQAETFLMRLARGGGIDGLGGMRAREERIWVRLAHPVDERRISFHRPLLSIPKVRLEATLRGLGGGYLQDPSNEDPRHERVRLRALHAERQRLGLTSEALGLAARRLASARSALETARHALARAAVELHGGAAATLDTRLLLEASPELALRVLQAVIGAFGGQKVAPARSQVERLLARLGERRLAVTLGGTIIRRAGGGHWTAGGEHDLLICREVGRRPQPEVRLQPGEGLFWDRRFYVSLAPDFAGAVLVRPLGEVGYARLKRRIGRTARPVLPSRVAAGLPSVWSGDRLLAVAALDWTGSQPAGTCRHGKADLVIAFAPQHVRAVLGDDAPRAGGASSG